MVHAAARNLEPHIGAEPNPVVVQLGALSERDDLVAAGVMEQHGRGGRDRAEPILPKAGTPLGELETLGCVISDARRKRGPERNARKIDEPRSSRMPGRAIGVRIASRSSSG
jgi:hypothetical protein